MIWSSKEGCIQVCGWLKDFQEGMDCLRWTEMLESFGMGEIRGVRRMNKGRAVVIKQELFKFSSQKGSAS